MDNTEEAGTAGAQVAKEMQKHLKAVVRTEEMMRGPPLAPITARTRPSMPATSHPVAVKFHAYALLA